MATLDKIFSEADKKWGKGTMTMGTALGEDYPRIPTGIFALDYSTGGGFPIGVTSSIYGPPGGGKSLTLARAVSCAQKMCWKCLDYEWDCQCSQGPEKKKVVYVTTEIFDQTWVEQLGVITDELVVAEPDYGEQAADIIIETLRADDCCLVVLDSIAMLTPIAELEGSAEDQLIGAQARLIAKMVRKIKATLVREKKRNHRMTFITTNQIRAKIGAMFGPSEEVPGGFVSKHDWHLTLRMSQIKSDDTDKETELPVNAKFKSSMIAMGNKRKVLTLAGTSEFFVTVSELGEFKKGTINDFKTVEKYADQIEFIGRNPWTLFNKTYDKKSDILSEWVENEELFLTTKRRLIREYVEQAKFNAQGGSI